MNVNPREALTPEERAHWERLLKSRQDRLVRFYDLKAPQVIIDKERQMIADAQRKLGIQ